MQIQEISSARNPKIRELLLLQEKSRSRKELDLFVVEGKREVGIAIEAHYALTGLFICRELAKDFTIHTCGMENIYEVPAHLYEKISYRGSTEGVIAIFKKQPKLLDSIILSNNPLVIILENIEKPGNVGAVLRTADAVNADAVIICDTKTDIYNPNVIRSSLGGFFTVQTAICSSSQAYEWVIKNKISIHTAQLQDSELYYKANMKGPSAIVMGAESEGLSIFWREKSDSKIKIPMLGIMDSLNVSVSAAILCYEALRQRKEL